MLFVSILKTIHLDVTPSAWPAASRPAPPRFSSRKAAWSYEGALDGRSAARDRSGRLARQSSGGVFFFFFEGQGGCYEMTKQPLGYLSTYGATQGVGWKPDLGRMCKHALLFLHVFQQQNFKNVLLSAYAG